jgi:large subunit ribosomal protein L22
MATRQREKTEKIAKERDRRPTAIARNIRIPSGKIEIVLNLIRGKTYEEAVAILNNTGKSASLPVLKVLNSAAANAENNLNIVKDNLYVSQCWAMAGPTLKRMMPRARGRADRILKRTAHIRIILDEKIDLNSFAKRKAVYKALEKDSPDVGDGKTKVKGETVKKTGQTKQVPVTKAERPLTDEPNTNPLGKKKNTAKSGVSSAKTAKPKMEVK